MRHLLAPALALLLLVGGASHAQEPAAPPVETETSSIHAPLDALLKAHVRDGRVDYAALKKDEAKLDGYLTTLDTTRVPGLSADAKLAFWINAYNAYTLKTILGRYPKIESIRDVWRVFSRRDHAVAGKKRSLDDIEHEILRKRWDEPRIHFAVVCASKSCPELRGEAFLPERVHEQMAEQEALFLADREKGLAWGDEKGWLGGTNRVVRVSKILDWYEEDFEEAEGSVLQFVVRRGPATLARYAETHGDDIDLEHFDYDWTLNDVERKAPQEDE